MVALMVFRSGRHIEPELLDELDPDAARASLRDLVRINRFAGGHRALRDSFRRCFREDEPFSMLDVGAASGDAAAEVRRIFPKARAVNLDYKLPHLAAARGDRLVADAFQLPIADNSVDVVYCGLFLHHFTDGDAARLLRDFGRVARRFVIVNDLERHAVPYYFLPATRWLFRWDAVTLHDGPASVQAGFTKKELLKLAAEAGLRNPRVRTYPPLFRLALIASPA